MNQPRHRYLPVLLLSLMFPSRALTQPAPAPVYDVVSIVINKEGDTGMSSVESHEATFTAINADLKTLLVNAFEIKPDLITGIPQSLSSTRWNLQAKITDPDLPSLKNLTPDQYRSMVAKVLADRFNLKVHTEIRQLPVYDLVLTSHGPKFKPSQQQGADSPQGMSSDAHDVTLNACPLSCLTYTLSGLLHRTVIDKTNLTAHYDLHLSWAPERSAGPDNGQLEDPGPSVFSAIQDQLGLRLVPAQGPVPILVIDHVDNPTPN